MVIFVARGWQCRRVDAAATSTQLFAHQQSVRKNTLPQDKVLLVPVATLLKAMMLPQGDSRLRYGGLTEAIYRELLVGVVELEDVAYLCDGLIDREWELAAATRRTQTQMGW